ncbi:MAG: protein kinase [Firmicutes bacterium]|nr:protein kinase [Bacillota bacterium]
MNRCYQCMREYEEEYEICPYCGGEKDPKPKELYFLTPGTMIADRYEIGVSIGSGGFGITYKAWDCTLAKIVAVKEYYPAGMVNRVPGEKKLIIYSGSRERECANGKVRFLEEARNMAKFNTHPNIINVYDFFEENNTAYIIMEFLDGVNYKEYIKAEGGRVPLEKALEVTQAVLSALEEVHKNGILHRDISPDNIFMCSDGHIKLIDFGAARFSAKDEEKTRSVILKPGFAPPEQYQTKSRQGPWTDIYATAATLYRAVTGNVPEESVNRVEEDLLTEPKKFCPEMSVNLNNAIMRAMALRYELRFQSAEEFQKALLGEASVRNVGKELKTRKIRRSLSIAAVSAVAFIGIFSCLKVVEQRKKAAAILEPADISIWVCADSGELPSEKAAIWEEALAEFREEYPQIAVTVQCMEEQEYETAIYEAMEQETLPTLFDSSGLMKENFIYLADISSVFDFINAGDYWLFNRYEQFFPSKKQLPLAFQMPAVYYNTLVNTENRQVNELVEMEDFLVCKEGFLTWYNLYQAQEPVSDLALLEELEPAGGPMSDKERFLSGENACLIADTSVYSWVQANLPGIYEIGFFDTKGMAGRLQDYFSISEAASAEEKAAAIQVLVYLLADSAQDVCYVQNEGGIPLNKKIYAAYVEINREFEKLSEGFSKVEMAGEDQALLDRWLENSVKQKQ